VDVAQSQTQAQAEPEASAEPTPAPKPEAPALEEPSESASPPPPPRDLPEGYLAFEGACDPGQTITIAAIGDIMGHRELQRQAYRSDRGFRDLWGSIEDLLGRADVTYGNLETPSARGLLRTGSETGDPGRTFDNHVYSGYAKFNVHASIVEDLVNTGFDIVSTANNHALDREFLGVDRTLEVLDDAGLKHTGTRRQGSNDPWHAVTTVEGMSIAWVACTKHTNFGKDDHDQVLDCFEKADRVRDLVSTLARDPNIDAVIVTPHWGNEYSHEPNERQLEHAQRWADAGATAILGSHPHVIEPWTKLTTRDGREVFVIYSLGNFVSHQRTLNRRSTVILYLGLRKTADGVRVVGARYVPVHVRMVGNKHAFHAEAIDRVGGPQDARKLLVDLLGPDNLMAPDEELEVAPHCDPQWEFPSRR
jgi:poly-gamma-glutamate synthesis protein (capsule biosynthesis protein)